MIDRILKSCHVCWLVPGRASHEFSKSSPSQQSCTSFHFSCHYINLLYCINRLSAVLEVESAKVSGIKFCFIGTTGVFTISNLIVEVNSQGLVVDECTLVNSLD